MKDKNKGKDTGHENETSIWKSLNDEELHEKSDSNNDNLGEEEVSQNTLISRRRLFIIGGIAAVSAAPLGIGAGYLYKKETTNREASSQLNKLQSTHGRIIPVNTSTTTFEGQMLENVNIDQKSLVGGAENTASEAAVFIYSNGKNAAKRILDLYVDFDSQRSRDFILINQSSLKNMTENGLIELRIHPVSSGSALSIYSPEALAESFVTSPDRSWDFMLSLLKLSAEVQASGDIEILPAVEEKIEENGITDISAESIQNGTFSSWIIAVGNDPRLATGYYPPIVYVNDSIVDPEVVDFNNTDGFRRHILSFDVKE